MWKDHCIFFDLIMFSIATIVQIHYTHCRRIYILLLRIIFVNNFFVFLECILHVLYYYGLRIVITTGNNFILIPTADTGFNLNLEFIYGIVSCIKKEKMFIQIKKIRYYNVYIHKLKLSINYSD